MVHRVRHLVWALSLLPLIAIGRAAPAGQSILENHRTLTFDCQGGYVRVDGNLNVLTITGSCTVLTVEGNKNKIRVATVGSIVLDGNQNQVSWSKALTGARPVVSNTGSGNSVSKR
jgi:Protein of unknown function (DUF3060)